ncbi:MAG: hypothetical protein AB7F99_10790 [Vicinamibacterales bacterium]
MNQAATRVLTVGALALVGWAAGGVLVGAAFAVATTVGVWLAGCRHPGPLALLPSVTDPAGTRVPARWCCHDCGATWPAALDDGHAPVRRFEGYDERKAAEAAKRATDLERRQRELAVRRAGWTPRPDEPAARHATLKLERPARPVAVRSRRAG